MLRFFVELEWPGGEHRYVTLDSYAELTNEQITERPHVATYAETPGGDWYRLSDRDARWLRMGARRPASGRFPTV